MKPTKQLVERVAKVLHQTYHLSRAGIYVSREMSKEEKRVWTDTARAAIREWEEGMSDTWTIQTPQEQGWYWHLFGDVDCAPFPLSVLYSGTSGKCFVSSGQAGITESVDCDEFRGYWMPLKEPKTP